MATLRDRPYARFNFLVDLGDGQTQGPDGGFAELSGLSQEVEVIEYRNGNASENAPMKLPGLARTGNVTLRRGLIGSLKLWQWMAQVRDGGADTLRTVTISLMNEDHSATVMSWRLLRARIVKHTSGPLNARGGDVAMEEIVLAFERLEIE